jgi:hypothetical protein
MYFYVIYVCDLREYAKYLCDMDVCILCIHECH